MIKIAIIGLDTSHSIEYPRRMQAPDCPKDQRVPGLRAVSCLRFKTPFQSKEGLDKRQHQLESWGVKVTTDFDESVDGCDAIMLEINDGSYHLEYFKKVAALGKPVFMDKPLANTLAHGRAILKLAKKHKTRVWSGSSIPFCPDVSRAISRVSDIWIGHTFGALGKAAAGDSLIWYGVHTFELLQRFMGPGAKSVRAVETKGGIISAVDYGNNRQGLVEAVRGSYTYGGRIQGKEKMVQFTCDSRYFYRDILRRIKVFFNGGPAPVDMTTTFEGLAMMVAARKSIETGKSAKVARFSR